MTTTGVRMTTTRKAVGETRDGEHVSNTPDGEDLTAWHLDAIGRWYDEAKANIADVAGASTAHDLNDPWPQTERIDVRTIRPPVASRGSSREPASASCPEEVVAPTRHLAPEPPAVPGGPRRAWRRWFSVRTGPNP
jgi:hypothetical protein